MRNTLHVHFTPLQWDLLKQARQAQQELSELDSFEDARLNLSEIARQAILSHVRHTIARRDHERQRRLQQV